jgi:hypothetical protein
MLRASIADGAGALQKVSATPNWALRRDFAGAPQLAITNVTEPILMRPAQRLWVIVLAAVSAHASHAQDRGAVAAKPLYRDPVYDGAADPVVIWNPGVKKSWMFYTNRRANAPGLSGVAWVHGTPIGIAESANEGATWTYVADAEFELPEGAAGDEPTLWAPDVVRGDDGRWHMFLTIVPGVFEDWGHPRAIVHLRSDDLRHWGEGEPLALASDRCIDATVFTAPDGSWRMWYNNERDGKSIYLATSPNLDEWTDHGKVIGDRGCEAPKVFRWKDRYWMLVDAWAGLGVYRSDDTEPWTRQSDNLLEAPGQGADDQVKGGHCDVVVSGDQAFVFYFTHPGRRGPDERRDGVEQRRSSIQVVELKVTDDGWLACDRDAPTHIRLAPPSE